MNIFDEKIAIKDNTFNKYGWTNNIRVRYYLEVLHDYNSVYSIILNDKKAFVYLLKRCIYTKRTTLFKKLFSVHYMNKCDEAFLQYLLFLTIKRNNKVLFDYLFDNYKFTYISLEIRFSFYEKEAEKYDFYFLNKLHLIIKDKMPKFNFNTIQNLYNIAVFNKDLYMKYIIENMLNNFNLFNNEKREYFSVKDALGYFLYED